MQSYQETGVDAGDQFCVIDFICFSPRFQWLQSEGLKLRIDNQKERAVNAFKELGFYVAAAGDSYNDTAMLKEADVGVLFRPPLNVVQEFPQFDVVKEYDQLLAKIEKC